MIARIGLIGLMSVLLFSCGEGGWLVEQQFDETTGGWPAEESVDFRFANASPGSKQLQIDFRFAADYPYQNIWLQLEMTDPQGNLSTLLIGDTLMDVSGAWIDQPEVGAKVDWRLQPAPTIELSQSGEYQFRLRQYMRENILTGVEEVKLKLVP
ncbi:MAG: gliding motility lipoprotein GldH [Bacteroidota bacterium]